MFSIIISTQSTLFYIFQWFVYHFEFIAGLNSDLAHDIIGVIRKYIRVE